MGIIDLVREGLRIARTHKSLWLFGFLVAAGSGGNGGGGGGGDGQPGPVGVTPPELGTVLPIALAVIVLIVAMIILRFLATGALIEGVKRARSNGAMTMREGFREGWAHWGVLFRLGVLYILMTFGSVVLLVGPCVLVGRALGSPAVVVAGGIAALVGVPWLLTLYMWQSFAERIAVLENRHALDAMRKARLFLHDRLRLGLKLLVAALLGALFVAAIGALVIGPLLLLFVSLAPLWGFPAIALGALTILPLAFVAYAFVGVTTSSVWTIGYLTQVEQ